MNNKLLLLLLLLETVVSIEIEGFEDEVLLGGTSQIHRAEQNVSFVADRHKGIPAAAAAAAVAACSFFEGEVRGFEVYRHLIAEIEGLKGRQQLVILIPPAAAAAAVIGVDLQK